MKETQARTRRRVGTNRSRHKCFLLCCFGLAKKGVLAGVAAFPVIRLKAFGAVRARQEKAVDAQHEGIFLWRV
jgi:hypothetical protein